MLGWLLLALELAFIQLIPNANIGWFRRQGKWTLARNYERDSHLL